MLQIRFFDNLKTFFLLLLNQMFLKHNLHLHFHFHMKILFFEQKYLSYYIFFLFFKVGYTPLHNAVQKEHGNIVQNLLNRGGKC